MKKVCALVLLAYIQSNTVVPESSQGSPLLPRSKYTMAVEELEQRIFERTRAPIQQLDIDLITLGPDFSGTEPTDVSWAGDNSRLWFRWKRPGELERGAFEVARSGGEPRRLSKSEEVQVPPAKSVRDASGRYAVYVFEGDIIWLDTNEKAFRKLTDTAEAESDPQLSHDRKTVAFRRGDNLFSIPSEGLPVFRQLTDIRPGKDPEAEKHKAEEEGSGKFLKTQQEELFRALEKKAQKEKEEEDRKKSRRPQPLFIDEKKVQKLLLSPSERYVAVEFSKESKEAKVAEVPAYITLSGYTASSKSRTKAGESQTRASVSLLDLQTGNLFEIRLPKGADSDTANHAAKDEESKSPLVEVFDPVWCKESDELLVTVRSFDNKDQWLLGANPATESVRVINHEHDPAWVLNSDDSPSTSQLEYGFRQSGREVWFLSERTGFRNLYIQPWEAEGTRNLTEGRYEVWNVQLSKDQNTFYFRANREGPEVMHCYALRIEPYSLDRLTVEDGFHQLILSPDEAFAADVYSFSNKPWELYVQPLKNSSDRRRLTHSPTPAFSSYPWIEPKLIRIPASDGTPIPAKLYLPSKPHPSKPAVIFVHGAGYLQDVHRWWSYYYREYMFHHFLMERGYQVLEVDYRGSAGYGRDWRTAIYRHMGGKDLSDQLDAARYLSQQFGTQPEHIGIYGGSYGGFLTLMALFTAPKYFGAGAALRPVTDWAHYNHPYTSNILNQPQDDANAYQQSSPIYFADGLEDPLLICHGIIDNNVHVQDTIRLQQRLIELRKKNFEVALYPVEDHAFKEASSWADEYGRIFRLFETFLK